ncbi:S1C family serine protease [Priestia filamentosa]|uniref:Peptidase S1 n=1 Tax=Priestia filamentosa TaxID=1402861 RepID=A0A1X7F8A3_9BACI|nr:trypsin-like peptidase domain-containing protein [Priestia filamentosa]AKO91843.1 peptidase S1 [Priestia filamentosa]MDT3761988.1 trypsin-like peptidase domain-containing protein [Priestia filamentosa]OXS68072.1 peptidase S1 [Priestia filamentosa]RJS64725.1 peptidase S1 [Priestia filamentosa]WCM17076.1 trypsin-like peptidase domain-containing protein [Priestia filamentosa]
MGYYDDSESQEQYRSQKKRNPVFTFLIMIIVAVVSSAATVFFMTSDEFGLLEDKANTASSQTTTTSSLPIKNAVAVKSDTTKAVDKALESVVGIYTYQGNQLFEGTTETGAGSGVIYKKSGDYAYIVTNHHVVDGASQVEVQVSEGTRLQAKVVGSDELTDLAVLRIDGSKVNSVAELGDSSKLTLGEPAIAIGNPLGFLEGSVTEGIISSTNRTIPVDTNGDGQEDWQSEVIQTDASINPGNSGGALINIDGQVIGINSSKIAQDEVEGIGFAIPMNVAKPIIEDLEQDGKVDRPTLGVRIADLSQVNPVGRTETLKLPDSVQEGVVIIEVEGSSLAEKAGLKQYDVITKVNGDKISSDAELRRSIYESNGKKMSITYYRNGKEQTTTVSF